MPAVATIAFTAGSIDRFRFLCEYIALNAPLNQHDLYLGGIWDGEQERGTVGLFIYSGGGAAVQPELQAFSEDLEGGKYQQLQGLQALELVFDSAEVVASLERGPILSADVLPALRSFEPERVYVAVQSMSPEIYAWLDDFSHGVASWRLITLPSWQEYLDATCNLLIPEGYTVREGTSDFLCHPCTQKGERYRPTEMVSRANVPVTFQRPAEAVHFIRHHAWLLGIRAESTPVPG